MPTTTTNYGLKLCDEVADAGQLFIDYRVDMNGNTGTSNINIIDTQMKANADAVDDLAGVGRTTETVKDNADAITTLKNKDQYYISATGTDTYVATSSEITAYTTGMIILLSVGTTNTGNSTININTLGVKQLTKVNQSGVNDVLVAGDLKPNQLYQFRYDGTAFRLIGTIDIPADKTYILDAGNYYTATNVETTLQELGANFVVSTTTTHTQTTSIASLPGASKFAPMKKLKLYGLSLVNSVVNGDFSNGTTGWSASNSVLSASNKVLSVTGTGGSNIVRTQKDLGIKPSSGSNLYRKVRARVTNSNATSIEVLFRDGTSGTIIALVSINSPTQNQWYDFSTIATLASSLTNNLYISIQHLYADAATANGKVMEVDGNAGVFAINMTALGLESYTEAQMLDLVRGGYFSGLQGVESPVLKTVGKNLFDKNAAFRSYVVNTSGAVIAGATTDTVSELIRVKPSTVYYRNNTTTLALYDSVGSFVRYVTTNQFTTASNELYVRFNVLVANLETTQLEESAIATEYSTYESSILSFPAAQLRRAPNGVMDILEQTDGKSVLTQNVAEYTLQAGDVATPVTSGTNVDIYYTVTPFKADLKTGGLNSSLKLTMITDRFKEVVFDIRDAIGNENSFVLTPTGQLGFVVAKGTYANLAAAQAALAGTVIHYQLATPVITDLTATNQVEGGLSSFEDGTLINDANYFASPSLTAEVATNDGAIIDGLVEEANGIRKEVKGFKDTAVSATTKDLTFYVATTGSDSNDGSVEAPFLAIAKAVSMIPKIVDHTVTINVAAGTYAEPILIKGFVGKGSILVNGGTDLATAANYNITYAEIFYNSCNITIAGFKATSATNRAFQVTGCTLVSLNYCTSTVSATSYYGVYVSYSNVQTVGCSMSNRDAALFAYTCANVYSYNWTAGSGNTYGIVASRGHISKTGTQPQGTTAELSGSGGMIVNEGGLTAGGGQYAFPATQNPSADANTLDDYEEGTFTPTIIGATTAGVGTYTTQTGRYTKIGNRVFVDIALAWTAHTGTGDMKISGLPFTSYSGSSFSVPAFRTINIALTASYYITAYVESNNTTIYLRQCLTGTGTDASVPIDAAGTIMCSAVYAV